MAEKRFCCVRFNLDKDEHRKAWTYLQSMDRRTMKSYSNVIIKAINKFFERDKTEDEIIKKLYRMINGDGDLNKTVSEEYTDDNKDIEWGFLGD